MKVGDLVYYRVDKPIHSLEKFPPAHTVGVIISCTGDKDLLESTRSKGVYHRAYEVMWSLVDGPKTLWHPEYKLLLLSSAEK